MERILDKKNEANSEKDVERDFEALKAAIREKESSNNYKSNNGIYKGAYQLGTGALLDIKAIDENGNWTGKYGHSLEEFLNSKKIQDAAMDEWLQINWIRIKENAKDKIGTTINGVILTESGMLAASHLIGTGNFNDYLLDNGKTKKKRYADGNNTHIEEYLMRFADYDVSHITRTEYKEHYFENFKEEHMDDIEAEIKRNGDKKAVGMEKIRKKFYEALPKRGISRSNAHKRWFKKGLKEEVIVKPEDNNSNKKSMVNPDGIEINNKKLADLPEKEQAEFWEGFDKNEIGNPKDYPFEGTKTASKKEDNWTKDFNIGNPNTDDGHWITIKNGKHLFIKDKVS